MTLPAVTPDTIVLLTVTWHGSPGGRQVKYGDPWSGEARGWTEGAAPRARHRLALYMPRRGRRGALTIVEADVIVGGRHHGFHGHGHGEGCWRVGCRRHIGGRHSRQHGRRRVPRHSHNLGDLRPVLAGVNSDPGAHELQGKDGGGGRAGLRLSTRLGGPCLLGPARAVPADGAAGPSRCNLQAGVTLRPRLDFRACRPLLKPKEPARNPMPSTCFIWIEPVTGWELFVRFTCKKLSMQWSECRANRRPVHRSVAASTATRCCSPGPVLARPYRVPP